MPIHLDTSRDNVQGPTAEKSKRGFRRWIANKMFGRHSRDMVLKKVARGKAGFTGCSGDHTPTKIIDASILHINALCGFNGRLSPTVTPTSGPGRAGKLGLFDGYYDQVPVADQADDLAILIRYSQNVTEPDATTPPPRQFNPGTAMLPYTIQDFLGYGSMGVVYTATHADQEVVVKLARKARMIGPTMKEFILMRKLNHQNIVQALSPVRGGFVMERLYKDLATLLESGNPNNPTSQDKVRIAAGVVDGMKFLHSRGIAHLDLKPANVLLDREYTPKVCDFGFSARFLYPAQGKQRLLQSFVGTPAYMSPELLRFKCGGAGPRGVLMAPVDVWAAGILIYELLTRDVPFGDDEENAILKRQMDLATSGLTVPPSAVSAMRDDKDVALLFLATQKMLDLRPDKRPSAAHMAKIFRIYKVMSQIKTKTKTKKKKK